MPGLSPARVRLALLALALGGFGIGATEFVAMGVLPEIGAELLPELTRSAPEEAIARAGIMISAYALGVVVGAPTIAALSAKLPRRGLLLGLAIAFTIGTVLSAVAPTFETVVAARFIAGLPHGAYFGVASLVAGELMGPGKRGRGVAFVLSGLTIANVIGVPSITFLGQQYGWRVAYLVVAGIFALTALAIGLLVPAHPGDPTATLRRELGVFGRGQIWLTLAAGAIGFAGFFAVYSYVAKLTTEVAGLGTGIVPFALATLGIGMTAGNVVGGRLADRGAMRAVLILLPTMAVACAAVALLSVWPVGMFIGLFLVGAVCGGVGPAVQTRLMDVAGEAQTLAAALNHSALNIGNSMGAAVGGATIAAGLGYTSPAWVGAIVAAAGMIFAVVSFLLERARPESMSPTQNLDLTSAS
ncbi:MFS transporter [Schumannella sp. 10F1B-5-1]|uniref:MFS transporter n=1 Tax=Schumannella sp. 10F1B-5-1 TaxID=2590780 RepID=UPI001C6435B1|nr:MFS transporter [Schumannella sp. 10F1B-5-1]